MTLLYEMLSALRDFFEAGGVVLWVVFTATVVMWTLILERTGFLFFELPARIARAERTWSVRAEKHSWYAQRIRERLVSEIAVATRRHLPLIKALMSTLPLLGLLGTVSGMIRVFDVMALTGTGNARAMAGGVAQATIPTMAGLVAALSGLYFATMLERRANNEIERVEELLSH